jgi:hypothetical protein
MQECYYQLYTNTIGTKLTEVVSDEDSCGRKLSGDIFKKVFDNFGCRIQFENQAKRNLELVSNRIHEEEIKEEFLQNCTTIIDKFGV